MCFLVNPSAFYCLEGTGEGVVGLSPGGNVCTGRWEDLLRVECWGGTQNRTSSCVTWLHVGLLIQSASLDLGKTVM